MNPNDFLRVLDERYLDKQEVFAFGTIPNTYAAGRPTIKFDGETTTSTKTYPYLSSYVPAANDRVMLARVRSGWVILGKVV